MNESAREVQEEVVDDEEVCDPENTHSVMNIVPNTILNQFEHECLDEEFRLLNAHALCQSPDDRVQGSKNSIQDLPGTQFQAQWVLAIRFLMRRWVWDADMAGALAVDELGLGKTVTLVAAAMLCNLVTKKVVTMLPLSILLGNTPEEWEILAHNDFPSIVGKNESAVCSRD